MIVALFTIIIIYSLTLITTHITFNRSPSGVQYLTINEQSLMWVEVIIKIIIIIIIVYIYIIIIKIIIYL